MEERRRSPRHEVQDLRGVLVISTEARIVDVSLTGAALALTAPVRTGQGYTLKLRSQTEVVGFQGRVIWCRPVAPQRDEAGEAVPTYHAGFRFDGVLATPGERLLEVFHDSVVLSFGQRLCARFRLHTPRPVNLASEHEFEVRKISRNGMLIETDLAADLGSQCELEVDLRGVEFRPRGRIAHLISHATDGGERGRSRYQLGIEFVALDDSNRTALEGFLAPREAAR
jgi:PilZ domain